VIEISDLEVRFGNVKPIDHLSATLSDPVCGLIGPNGAGKTTLLNVFSGFVIPIKGRIQLDGVSLLELNSLQRVQHGLRRSFQTEQVVEDLTIYDNLAALADNVLPARQRPATIRRALEFIGLSALAHQLGGSLNLFQRRLVELGKCLIGQPNLILLDEPTKGVDIGAKADIYDIIRNLGREGRSILVVSSEEEELMEICDRIAIFRHGCCDGHALPVADWSAARLRKAAWKEEGANT